MPLIRSRPIRRQRNLIACIVIMCCCSFYILSYPVLQQSVLSSKPIRQPFVEFVPPHCGCRNNDTMKMHNFCYLLPSNTSKIGRPFSCHFLDHLRNLALLDMDPLNFIEIGLSASCQNDNGNSYYASPYSPSLGFPQPVFVTASSDSHFQETLVLISTLQKFQPMQKIVFYDLGLSESMINQLRRVCDVEYRKFNFAAYPDYVANLVEYRWKPLIIAASLKEFGAVWYMDSSVVFKSGNLSHVYGLLKCHANKSSPSLWKAPHLLQILPKNDPGWIESGFHPDRYEEAIRFCFKFAYMLQGFTGHGVFSATNPEVYKYLPTDESKLKSKWVKMYEAGFLFAVRTHEVVQDVLKWYVLCALEKDCMAPPGSGLGCGFNADRFGEYAGCHRFDQSIINLLLANRNNFDSLYWTSGIVDFFNIVRGGATGEQLKYCATEKPPLPTVNSVV